LGGIHTFGFEVSTVNREFFFGSGDEQSRDDWICAFKLARETYFLRKGYYTHSYRDMTLKDLDYFATLFRKQVSVHYSICREDKKFTVSSTGLNVGDLTAVSRYLHFECMASGTSSMLLTLLHQLLLILAAGSEIFWTDICTAVKAVMNERCGGECNLSKVELLDKNCSN